MDHLLTALLFTARYLSVSACILLSLSALQYPENEARLPNFKSNIGRAQLSPLHGYPTNSTSLHKMRSILYSPDTREHLKRSTTRTVVQSEVQASLSEAVLFVTVGATLEPVSETSVVFTEHGAFDSRTNTLHFLYSRGSPRGLLCSDGHSSASRSPGELVLAGTVSTTVVKASKDGLRRSNHTFVTSMSSRKQRIIETISCEAKNA
ncbi:hypothetical protein IW262DRAFT_1295983 [Armillaria fumosa]|nr:hypothetical protein IW262DRAFT_1295983 [Armillaria fumosa]